MPTEAKSASTSHEIIGQQLFEESLSTKKLPRELTPSLFIETVDYPTHFPSITTLLKAFGRSSKTTYRTEYNAVYLPEENRHSVMGRYESERQVSTIPKPTAYHNSRPHSPRLQMLCAAHGQDWENVGQKLYHIMMERVGPSFGYLFDLNNPLDTNQAGDFNLVTQWLTNHLPQLEPYLFNHQDIATAASQIARHRRISVDHGLITKVNSEWFKIIGPVNLDSSRVKKGKVVNPNPNHPARAGETSITHTFEELFVDLDLHDSEAIGKALDIDDLDNEAHVHFQNHINRLHLLMLSFIKDHPDGLRPIQKLSQLTQIDLDYALSTFRFVASLPQTSGERTKTMNAIDPALGQRSLKQALNDILVAFDQSPCSGLGASRALLIHYTELKLKNDPRSEEVEKIMHQFNLLASDSNAIQKLNLNSLFEE
jgi:hypothetical protein